jgi:diphosphomevalonate decarboxylase
LNPISTKADVVHHLLADRPRTPARATGHAFAPANIALCKYWGKRNATLNLPTNSSLSLSLGNLGAHTEVQGNDIGHDRIWLNDAPLAADTPFAQRLTAYLDLIRPPDTGFDVRTVSTIPIAAGLASSASGYAALVLALNQLFDWQLPPRHLSILARLGSGSASRSIYRGFAEWHAGTAADGMDSYAEALDIDWPDLRFGLLELSTAEKPVSSRAGMQHTLETSTLYQSWPTQTRADLANLHAALNQRDFEQLGQTAETNALAMHATMHAARPALCYWLPESLATMHKIWNLRAKGLPLYFTMDAGPNIKLLFLKESTPAIQTHFPTTRIIKP